MLAVLLSQLFVARSMRAPFITDIPPNAPAQLAQLLLHLTPHSEYQIKFTKLQKYNKESFLVHRYIRDQISPLAISKITEEWR